MNPQQFQLLENTMGIPPHLLESIGDKWDYLTEGVLDKDDGWHGKPTHTGFYSAEIARKKQLATNLMLHNTEKLLEAQLVSHFPGIKSLYEATTTSNIGSFTTWAFALIRKIFPRMLLWDLMTTIPVSQPTQKLFYLDFKRGTGDTSLSAKASFDRTYANATEGGSVKDAYFAITSTDVSVTEKKLKASWTVELEQDLVSYYGIGAMSEIMAELGNEVAREVNYDGINQLLDDATGGDVPFSTTVPEGLDEVNRLAYNHRLYEAIIDAQNAVFDKRYRKPNWIIAGTAAIARLEKLEQFKLSPDGSDGDFSIGRHYLGTIDRRLKVYVDPWFPDPTKILLGYKGDSWTDTGAAYCPYQPLYVTPLFTDPQTMISYRGLMSRHAIVTLVPALYSTVTLT